jgi:hypothetical protein
MAIDPACGVFKAACSILEGAGCRNRAARAAAYYACGYFDAIRGSFRLKEAYAPENGLYPRARHNPVNAFTMGGIVRDAGLSEEEFRALL